MLLKACHQNKGLPPAKGLAALLSGHRDKGVRRERQKDALELKGTRLADAWTKATGQCKQIIVRTGETESTMLSLSKDTSLSSSEQNAEQSRCFGIHHNGDLCLTQQLWQGLVSELASSLTKVDVIYIDLQSPVMFTLRCQDSVSHENVYCYNILNLG